MILHPMTDKLIQMMIDEMNKNNVNLDSVLKELEATNINLEESLNSKQEEEYDNEII